VAINDKTRTVKLNVLIHMAMTFNDVVSMKGDEHCYLRDKCIYHFIKINKRVYILYNQYASPPGT